MYAMRKPEYPTPHRNRKTVFDALQNFFMMDDPTFGFAGFFIVFFVVLYALSLVVGKRKPIAPGKRDEPKNRSAFIALSIETGKSFVGFIASLSITPNQITAIGLVLVFFNCGLFVVYENTFWLGSGLIAALLFDTLDGAVARAQGTSSKFGGYLDAVIDRYQEVVIYLVIGFVLDQWLPAFLIITGSMLISYNKARVALEVETSNKGWPDLLEKPVRLFILCVGLIGDGTLPWMLSFSLWMLVIMTHFTAIQRFVRAYFILVEDEAGLTQDSEKN